MKKTAKLLICLLGFSTVSTAQIANYEWVKSVGSASGSEWRSGIVLDDNGNSYSIISFSETTDFDPGTGVTNLTPFGSIDLCVQKLDANGNFVWAKQIGGQNSDIALSIAYDGNQGIVITGYFQGTADFDPGATVSTLTSAGFLDIFLLKMNTNGAFVWAKQIGGPFEERGYSVTTDVTGNIYVTGFFTETVDFNPGTGTSNLTAASGTFDAFVLKLNPSGDFVWAKKIGGSQEEEGHSIAVDAAGNVYTAGYFDGSVDLDPGSGTLIYNTVAGRDIFLQKLDANGSFVWGKQFGGFSYDTPFGLSESNGNIYMTGIFGATVDFDPSAGTSNLTSNGDNDVFVVKLNSNGEYVWVKQMGGSGQDVSASVFADQTGNVYTTGYFNGTVDFNPGTGTTNFTSNGSRDLFIQKLNTNGDFQWARQIRGSGSDYASSIVADLNERVYIVGSYRETVDFDPNSGTVNLTSNGESDAFILKLNQTDNVGIIENANASNFTIYPNPNNGTFQLDLGQNRNNISVRVTDANGKLLQTLEGVNGHILECSISVQPGIYFVEIQADGIIEVLRFMKE